MCWGNKTAEEINAIHERSRLTYVNKLRLGEIVPSFTNKKHKKESIEKYVCQQLSIWKIQLTVFRHDIQKTRVNILIT